MKNTIERTKNEGEDRSEQQESKTLKLDSDDLSNGKVIASWLSQIQSLSQPENKKTKQTIKRNID